MRSVKCIICAAVLLFIMMAGGAIAQSNGETAFRALLVGIDSYQSNPLNGCVNDASKMAAMLQAANEAGAFYQTPVIRSNLQSGEIMDLFEDISTWGIDDDDVTFFFYSGYGYMSEKGTAAIVGKDSKMLALTDIKDQLAAVPGIKLIVMDLRYADSLIDNGKTAGEALRNLNSAILGIFQDSSNTGIYLLSGATLASSAPEKGVLTYALCEGCGFDYSDGTPLDQLPADSNQNGAVSLKEAQEYIQQYVSRTQDNGVSLSCEIVSLPTGSAYPLIARRATAEVLDVQLPDEDVSVPAGKTVQLEAVTQPVNASLRSISWTSSDLSIATIDENGVVTGVKPGKVTIAATTANGLTRLCTVDVKDVKFVESLTMNASRLTLAAGSEMDLGLTVVPSFANEAIHWRSNDATIVSVDQHGHITCRSLGSTYVTAYSDNGIEAACSVQVVNTNEVVTAFKVNKTQVEVYEGGMFQFETKVAPDSAKDPIVTFVSQDPDIADVDSSDLLTGYSAGETTVLATSSAGQTATIRVRVKPASIKLSHSSVSLKSGKTGLIKTKVMPKSSDTVIKWTSSDITVATVEDGRVTGVGPGTCTITAMLPTGASATCKVSVDAVAIKGVAVNPKTANMTVGDTMNVNVSVNPSNASLDGISFKSSNERVATVDDSGLVTAVSAGKVIIRASAPNGKYADCKIIVKAIPVTKIDLDTTELSLIAGLSGQNMATIHATTEPADAGSGSLRWQSSNRKIATVNNIGVVTATGAGRAQIKVTDSTGKVAATCTVNVGYNGVKNSSPLFGDEARLYTSAKQIGYKKGQLMVQLYYYNRSKKTVTVPQAGKIVLTLADGKEITVTSVKAGKNKLKPGKKGDLLYHVPVSSRPELANLDLRGSSAALVTASGSTGVDAVPSAVEEETQETMPVGTASDAVPEETEVTVPVEAEEDEPLEGEDAEDEYITLDEEDEGDEDFFDDQEDIDLSAFLEDDEEDSLF